MRKAYDYGWTEIYILKHKELEREAQTLLDTEIPAGVWHAGELETSMMLYVKESLVHMEKATAEFPLFPKEWDSQAIPWKQILQSGAFGDSRSATAEKGEKLYKLWTKKLSESVKCILGKGK